MEKERFEIKPEHLKLIRRFCIGWQDCEFGAPEIDPKRPYGNSDVIQDMVDRHNVEITHLKSHLTEQVNSFNYS